jgi:outer membrane protein insertion porin family
MLALSPLARASEPFDAAVITEIQIEGNSTVARDVILGHLRVRPGDRVGEVRLLVNRDLKELWKTGKFHDVNFSILPLPDQSVALVVRVQEKPLIRTLGLDGNLNLGSAELLEKCGLKTGQPYDEATAGQAAQKLMDYYKEKEFFQAKVVPTAVTGPGGVDLVFKVQEGMKVKVVRITVTGNQAFSADKIKGFMETKEAGWFVGGTYKEATFKTDLKKVLIEYAREGYAKAEIFGADLQALDARMPEILGQALSLDEAKQEMSIALTVSEGRQYTLGAIEVKGNIIYSEEELLARTQLRSGVVFNRVQFENDLQQIRMAYSEKGYIFADVTPELTFQDDAGRVDSVIWVKENTIARIERIDIRGNTITKEKVIRRELTVQAGEPFDTRQIQHSREMLMNLGFFQDVKVTTEPGSTPAEQVLVLEVEERQTGTISLGAGYSSVDKLMGYLQLTQANLFGNAQSVSLQWELGTLRQSYQMSFTEPWLFNAPVSFGVDVWNMYKARGWSGQPYNLLSQGGDLRLGRRFGAYLSGFLTYKLESEEYTGLSSLLAIQYVEGRTDTSSITPAVTYDTRDNIFDPTDGMLQRLSLEVAGGPLGGDNNYLRGLFDTSYFVPLIYPFVLAVHGGFGYVRAYGYEGAPPLEGGVLPAKRFRVGGTDTVRGYGEGVLSSGQGGVVKAVFNTEIHFPIIGPLKGVTFFDAGNSWDDPDRVLAKDSWLYKGVGAGIRLTVPGTVILIRFDFGYPLDLAYPGQPQNIMVHFNIGNIF